METSCDVLTHHTSINLQDQEKRNKIFILTVPSSTTAPLYT